MKADSSYSRLSVKIFQDFPPIFDRADLSLAIVPAHLGMPENPGRLRVLDWTTSAPVDAAEASDLPVGLGLNSTGVIAGLLGLKAIHWDCTGWLKCSVYRGKDQRVFLATLPEVRQAVMQAAAGDKTAGAFNKWRQRITHFDDWAGREGIWRFINLYMQGPNRLSPGWTQP